MLQYCPRIFLLNRIINKTNLTRPEFNILLVLYLFAPGSRFAVITKYLLKYKCQQASDKLADRLKTLQSLNLIIRTGYIYNITPSGIAQLLDIERRIKKAYYYK